MWVAAITMSALARSSGSSFAASSAGLRNSTLTMLDAITILLVSSVVKPITAMR